MQITLSGEAARARIAALVEPWIAERRAKGERVGDVLRHPAYGRIPVDALQAMPELGTLRDTLLREAGAMTDRAGKAIWSRRTVAAVLLLAAALLAPPLKAQSRQVRIAPDSIVLSVGDTVRPAVTVRAGNGAAVPNAVLSYSGASSAIITAHRDGLITARAVGCTTWRVTHATYARAQAAVCVTAAAPQPEPVDTVTPPPPPPPTAPSTFTQHLPAGLSLVTDTYFGNLLPCCRLNEDGLGMAWDGRNATDTSAPFGPAVFETFYPGNHRGNGEGGASLFSTGNRGWRQMYFAVMLWVPANYSMHTNGEKFFYPIVNTGNQQTSSFMLNWNIPAGAGYVGGAADSTWIFELQNQIGDPNRYQPPTTKRPVKGRWQRIEAHLVMNTPGQRNGVLRVWVDGEPAVAWTDAYFSAQPTQSTFDAIRFEGVRGGGASSVLTPPEGQVRRYSRLVFYAAP